MGKEVIMLFRDYMGTGLIIGWFLLSLGYLLIREKRKPVRIMFAYVPVILLLLFFNPLFAKLLYRFVDDEIYYRILWLVPVTIVIACAMVQIYGGMKGKARLLFAGMGSILIMISGSFIYQNPYFHKAENLYHVPQAVVEICDAIQIEGREVMAVFPKEMLQYVRQYSPVVCMPYGREILVDRWGNNNDLFDVMEAPVIEMDKLAPLAKEYSCHYVILPVEKEIVGNPEDYDYEYFGETQGYLIYRDKTMNFTLIPSA